MRGIVMEIQKKKMVIMQQDGTFVDTKYVSGAQIGEEVTISQPSPMWANMYKYAGVAAAIMIFITGGIQTKAYYTPYGYMNIDINPSIQVEYNKFDRIIGVEGLNEDGKKVIADTQSVENAKVEDGVKALVETAAKDEYIKADTDNDIMLSVYSEDDEDVDELNSKVNNSVQLFLSANGKNAQLINEIVNKEDFDKASLEGISVGKLILFRRAHDVDPSVTVEYVKTTPVRDIVKMINVAKQKAKDAEKVIKKEQKDSVEPITPQEPKDTKKANHPNAQSQKNKTDIEDEDNNEAISQTDQNINEQMDAKLEEVSQSTSQSDATNRIQEIQQRIKNIFRRGK